MQKKKSKRSETEYPNLDPNLNLKSRRDLIDFDYLDQLSPKDLKWLNQFVDEYVNANFKRGRKRILPKVLEKRRTKAGQRRTRDLNKYDSYKRNNARNADAYTKEKAAGMLHSLDDIKKLTPSPEDQIIRRIDRLEKKRNKLKNTVSRTAKRTKRTKKLKNTV